MYVVTFYSFKGGVGRSMALVNVGYQLANSGRTVLLVDFDLEAPGLHTFNLQRPQHLPPGMVDYVREYLDSGEPPEVIDHLYKSESFASGGSLWVMPAGTGAPEYASRFQSISWQDLYDRHDGFLLFENMKEQWHGAIRPDYVLIDSRTGHTDIAGICTRQLPDAVCVLFFPNEQNLLGLKRVVEDIRSETRAAKHDEARSIQLHFVVSNVPTLDDEEKIVATRLRDFKEQLGYDDLAAQIHHYDSLSLINQLVFSKDRPNSYLTREYGQLAEAIRRQNIADRDSALEMLRAMVRGSRGPSRNATRQAELSFAQLKEISTVFADDGEVSFWLGMAQRASGDLASALALYDRAIDLGFRSRAVYLERGTLYRDQQNTAAAIEDFWRVIEDRETRCSARETTVAIKALFDAGVQDVSRMAVSAAVKNLGIDDRLQAAQRFDDSVAGLQLTELLLSSSQKSGLYSDRVNNSIAHYLGVTLIGLRRFGEARMQLNPSSKPVKEMSQPTAFNVGMAFWGETGRLDRDLFSHVIALDTPESRPKGSANYFQCLAIAHWALGSTDAALSALQEARKLTKTIMVGDFSAWRYLRVDPLEFDRDLEELHELIRGERALPRMFSSSGPRV